MKNEQPSESVRKSSSRFAHIESPVAQYIHSSSRAIRGEKMELDSTHMDRCARKEYAYDTSYLLPEGYNKNSRSSANCHKECSVMESCHKDKIYVSVSRLSGPSLMSSNDRLKMRASGGSIGSNHSYGKSNPKQMEKALNY